MARLILGTAQFGAGYGITNSIGRIDDRSITGIVAAAQAAGIDTFDTAADYGDSQSRLGVLPFSADQRYVTKFSLPDDLDVAATAEVLFARSARVLGVGVLDGVLFHRVADLTDPRCAEAVDVLLAARSAGAVRRVGVSVYDVVDLELALSKFPGLDLVQIPGSIVDRRLLDSPIVSELKRNGVEIHVRSAFIQGLLLAEPESLPDYFAPLIPVLREVSRLAYERDTSVVGLAIGFLREHPLVHGVVVGATSIGELTATTVAWKAAGGPLPEIDVSVPEAILDPRNWPVIKVAK